MQNLSSPTPYVPLTKNAWDILFQPMIDEYFNPPQSFVSLVPAAAAPRLADLISTPSSTSIDQDESSASNGCEDLGKLKPKADSGIFVEYAPTKKACRIYNKQTRLIMETMHVEFDELTAMASEQFGSGPELQLLTP
ncbi:hypothetical protein Tco_1144528 [Tanacetum coccineum]